MKSDVKNLRKEADRLDREMERQKRSGAFVNVSAIPMFITSGTKKAIGSKSSRAET